MHSISVYLMRKEELREDKINFIIESEIQEKIKFRELGESIIAIVDIPNFEEFSKNKIIAYITTDYFGGSGFQTSTLWKNGNKEYFLSDEYDYGTHPINKVLSDLGIKRNEKFHDLFDQIGLDKFREDNDFLS